MLLQTWVETCLDVVTFRIAPEVIALSLLHFPVRFFFNIHLSSFCLINLIFTQINAHVKYTLK